MLNLAAGTKKYIYTLYVIPPHWYDTDSWNPLPSKTRTYLFYIVNIMGVLAQGAGASETMILTMLNRINSVPARYQFSLLKNKISRLPITGILWRKSTPPVDSTNTRPVVHVFTWSWIWLKYILSLINIINCSDGFMGMGGMWCNVK